MNLIKKLKNLFKKDNIILLAKPDETINEHTENLYVAFNNVVSFGNMNLTTKDKKYIKKLIHYHDRGKALLSFQNYIRPKSKRYFWKINSTIPTKLSQKDCYHEWLSPSFISKKDTKFFIKFGYNYLTIAYYIIAFHHSRNTIINKNNIIIAMDEIKNYLGKNYTGNNYITELEQIKIDVENYKFFDNHFKDIIMFKGLLHKCDYAASAHIDIEKKYKGNYNNDLINNFGKAFYNHQLNVKNHTDKSVVFVANTGAGKTEYAMNWINGDKSFYVLNTKVSVNAIYRRFLNMFSKDNVSLLHGASLFETSKDFDSENIFDEYNKIKLLSYPITISTADQLVPAVYKYPGFEFIYSTLSYSKIVVDEIQSFGPHTIAGIVMFLKEVYKLGGKFLVMTATLPKFIKDELSEMCNVIFDEPYLSDKIRHSIKVHENYINSDCATNIAISNFNNNKKVLVICNTVSEAQSLYIKYKNLVNNSSDIELLHSRFKTKDRRKKELSIEDFSKTSNSGKIFIATQVVETSLDIDFDILLTENSTIDSIFQRFGRCNRHGLKQVSENNSNIHIFKHSTNSEYIYDKDLLKSTYKILDIYDCMIIDEKLKQVIIDDVFNDIKNTNYYETYNKIKTDLENGKRWDNKGKALHEFRKINNINILMENDFNNLINDINLLESNDLSNIEKLKIKEKISEHYIPINRLLKKFSNNAIAISEAQSTYLKKHDVHILPNQYYTYTEELGLEY